MILLNKNHYDILINPLSKVTINNLFARSVVEKKVNGLIYVDNIENPGTFYIVHPYGISLLFGECTNTDFNYKFRDHALNIDKHRNKHEWMQAFPDRWDSVLTELFKDKVIKSVDNVKNIESNIIEQNTRVNFKFNHNKYLIYKSLNNSNNWGIVQTDKDIFTKMQGAVVPLNFWNNADDFCNNGVGFSLFYENKLASTAYSAFIHEKNLELGIETFAEFRGKGFAEHTCTALIDYCIENGYEPIWSCKFENTASLNLAQKLGFEIIRKFPFYRLSN